MSTFLWIILITIQVILCFSKVEIEENKIVNNNERIYIFHLGENLNINIDTEFQQSMVRSNSVNIYRTRQSSCLRGRICYRVGYKYITLMGIMTPEFMDLTITDGYTEQIYKIKHYKENKTVFLPYGQMINMDLTLKAQIFRAVSSEYMKYQCIDIHKFCYEFVRDKYIVHIEGRLPPHAQFLTLFHKTRKLPPYTITFYSHPDTSLRLFATDAYLYDQYNSNYEITNVYTFPQISETKSMSCESEQVCYRISEDKKKFELMGWMPAHPIYVSIFAISQTIPYITLKYQNDIYKSIVLAYGENIRINFDLYSQIENVTSDAELYDNYSCKKNKICYVIHGNYHEQIKIFGKSGPQFNYFTVFRVSGYPETYIIKLPKDVYEYESPLGEKISQVIIMKDEIKSAVSNIEISELVEGKCPDYKICVTYTKLPEGKVQVKITAIMDENLKYITFFKGAKDTSSILSIIYREVNASLTYEYKDKEYIDLKIDLPFEAYSHSPSLVIRTHRCPDFRICIRSNEYKSVRIEGNMDPELKYITFYSKSRQRGEAYTIKFKLKKKIE